MLDKRYLRQAALITFVAVGLLFQVATAQTWTPAGPIPRDLHSAVLDTTTNRMIVFGGLVGSANTNDNLNLNDVWRLNPSLTWTAVRPLGTPPAPRVGHSGVYDPGSNRMIIFGGAEGRSSPCENDVWVLTNANGVGGRSAWVQLSPSGGPPAPRLQQGAAYDPNTNTMIVYGGQDCFSTQFGDVWVLSNANGLGGTPTWTQLSPLGGGPGPREANGTVTYDAADNRLIVFGGSTPSMVMNDVWILTNANGSGATPTWTQLSPSGSLPSARASQSTVYDAVHNVLTTFGGYNSVGTPLGDGWVLSNANGLGGTPVWSQLGPFTTFPVARYRHSAVYNPAKNTMTIFGGASISGEAQLTSDVWVLSHANGQ